MPVGFSVTVLGSERVERRFTRIIDRSRNPRPIFLAITRDFRKMMVKQFDSQGAYLLGKRWQELADVTIKDKMNAGEDPRILHRTKKMRQAFTQGRGGFRIVGIDTLEIDVEQGYAGVHQRGTKKMPRRQIVKLGRREAARWSRMMQRYIVHGEIEIPA